MKLVVVGKIKDLHIKELCKEYEKRIGRFTNLDIIEIKDSGKEKEVQKILEVCGGYSIIALEEKGKGMDSFVFAEFIKNIDPKTAFVIGGPSGISSSLSCKKISLSTMTFPHEIARLLFLEQLYRAYTILKNIPYHK